MVNKFRDEFDARAAADAANRHSAGPAGQIKIAASPLS
jgi:hypothetical protein